MLMRAIEKFLERVAYRINKESKTLYISYKPTFQRKMRRMPEFERLLDVWVKHESGNVYDLNRLYMFYLQCQYIKENNLPGEVAEVGVYKGVSAKVFKTMLPEKELHLFDTFEGFDEENIKAEKAKGKQSNFDQMFTDTSLEAVREFVGTSGVRYYKGKFPDTVDEQSDHAKYSLVHLDADLYEPTIEGLRYFYPRLVKGGVLIVHDNYNSYVGCQNAVKEYFSEIGIRPIVIPDGAGSALVTKHHD